MKEHVGDRSISVFQIARCVASSLVRKASDKGDNRCGGCSAPPRNAFIPYVQRGERHETANTKTANRRNEMTSAQWHAQAAVTRHYTSYSIFLAAFFSRGSLAAAVPGPLKSSGVCSVNY